MGIYELGILVYVALWIVAFFDILRSDFAGNNKLIWFLAVVFVPLIGLIAYFFIGRKQKVKQG